MHRSALQEISMKKKKVTFILLSVHEMDLQDRKRLRQAIEKATTRANLSLDVSLVKQIKGLAKKSNDNVKSAYDFVFQQLHEDNAQVCANGSQY
jgi:hypothetical protein